MSSKSLKDYLTSEKDLMRGMTKVPSIKYRLWEQDVTPTDKSAFSHSDTLNSYEIDVNEFRKLLSE